MCGGENPSKPAKINQINSSPGAHPMNAGTLLKLIADVIDLLEAKGVITPSGDFDQAKLDTVQEDLDFAAAVEDLLKAYGLNVPTRVDSIIKILPLLFNLK